MESDADFLSRYWEELNWDTDDADFDRLFTLARRAAVQWRPIEEAPKDGMRILAYGEAGEIGHIMWWADYLGFWRDQIQVFTVGPTHFMPLPPPPEKDTQP